MEVTVGVNRYDGVATVIGVTQIVPHNCDFFDVEAKFEGKYDFFLPARLDPETYKTVEEMAKKAYNALQMTTTSRS